MAARRRRAIYARDAAGTPALERVEEVARRKSFPIEYEGHGKYFELAGLRAFCCGRKIHEMIWRRPRRIMTRW
jgi:hypothetical protein